MAKKTTKTDTSTSGAKRDVAPQKPARRTVAKLAGSVKKKIKAVLEPKAHRTDGAIPAAEPVTGGQSDSQSTGKRKSRGPAVAASSVPRKTNRTTAGNKRATQRGDGSIATSEYTNDDIALRAYFLAQHRMETGQPGSAEADWIEAERQLSAEKGSALVHS
ncbi:MAG: DUF2934 domain-containing protein [Chthoniobacteraceae bacterium]